MGPYHGPAPITTTNTAVITGTVRPYVFFVFVHLYDFDRRRFVFFSSVQFRHVRSERRRATANLRSGKCVTTIFVCVPSE